MNAHKKFSILSFVVFLSLVLSLVFPVAAMADDSTPPPPAAPASPAVDNPPAQTSNPDSSSNVAAPADAAPASPAADNPPAQTSNPDSSSNAAAPADVASMDAAPTDAAPKDAASTEAAATDVPSSSTGVVPTDSAATNVPSSSTDVAPTESAVTDAPSSLTDVASTNSAATNVPSSSTDVAPTESAATDVPVGPTADVVAALNNAGAVLLDENGNPLPLVSQQAADVLSVGDPIGCPAGVQPASFGGTGSGCTGSYTSIQSAINDGLVTNGWTIYIDAGSYYENVTINKSVTVLGKGQTQTFIYPNTNNPDIGCSGSCANSTNTVFLISADNVFVQDLTINGDSPILSGGQVVNGADINTHNGIVDNNNNGLTVENVTIKNVYARGIQYGKSGGTFTIQNNTIDNVAGDYYSIGIFNTGGSGTIKGNTVNNANDAISANHSQGTQFINNTVTNSGSGIHTDNYGDSGLVGTDLIDGNTISNGPANSYGIFVFAPYSPLTVSNNSITNVDYGLTLSGNGWHDPINTITFNNNTVNSNIAGAYVTTDVWGYFTSDVTAALNNNIFSGGQYGLYLESQGSGDSLPVGYSNGCTGDCKLNVTAFDNSITNHTLANVFYATGQIPWYGSVPDYNGVYNVNASGNWWGTNDPAAVASQIAAGVDYTPWLNSGTDTSLASGFQGDFSTVDVGANSPQTGSTGRIQEGVNLVTAGGTVNVTPGNYPEQVVIDGKNITVQGTAPGAVVQAVASMPTCFTTSDSNKPVICVKNATNVNIKGLTVDGAGQGNTNYRLDGIGYYNAGGTVQGNTIEHIRETPLNGDQHGVGLYAYTDILGISRTLNVFGNTIFDYQKNGMALSGNGLTVNVQNNTVTGAGPTPLTAQNGIQVSYGAIGTISGNTVSGNFWTGTYGGSNDPISDPKADSAAGILVYDPGSTAIQIFNNNIFDNQIGIASVAATSLNIHDNTIKGLPHTGNGYPAGIAIWDKDQWSPLEIGTTGTIQNNTITSNDYGVLIFNTPGGPTPIVGVHNNSITANTLYGVWSNTLTNATNNWWGNASGPHDNSVVPDACGLSLTNPTGGGNTASPCVLYDPWLTKDPFAGAGSGGDSGGNGRGQNATPIAGTVIPVTGGQLTTLSCSNPAVTMQIGDFKVTFTGLCGYDVVLNLVAKEDLPGNLGSGNSFDEGLSITLLKNGKEIKTLPVDASIQVSYPKPTSGSPSVMVWSGSAWIDQASFVDGNNIISNLAAPATLVLVTH